MAIYRKTDLEAANAAITILENDRQDAENLKKSINDFITSSNSKLKGASWDLVRNNLNNYITVLNTRITTAQNLANKIKSINNSLIAALGGNEYIDTDKLTELKSRYDQLNSQLYSIKSTSKEDNLNLNTVYIESEVLTVKKVIDDIENFSKAESTALSQVNNLDELNIYHSQAEGIQVSQIISADLI